MNPKQYLKDYYSKSPNDGIIDQLNNFGSEVGGGKAFINGALNVAKDVVRVPAILAAQGEGKLAGYLAGKNTDKFTQGKVDQINDFFKSDSLDNSSKEYPKINNLGTGLGYAIGGGLKGALAVKNGIRPFTNAISETANTGVVGALNTPKQQTQEVYPHTLAGYGKSLVNGIGATLANPITGLNNMLGEGSDMMLGTDHSKQRNKQNSNINNFFKF